MNFWFSTGEYLRLINQHITIDIVPHIIVTIHNSIQMAEWSETHRIIIASLVIVVFRGSCPGTSISIFSLKATESFFVDEFC